jgi:hypothetical protein
MEVYKTKEGFVLGVDGGDFYNLKSGPEAIILEDRPVPTKLWTVSTIKDRSLFKNEEWFVDFDCRGFSCDGREIFIINFRYHRKNPGYCSENAEFFVSEEYVKEKLNSLKKIKNVKEFSWDEKEGNWKEVHYKKHYRRAK